MSLTDINQVSLREKLKIEEAIWHDLRDHAENLEIPPSHRELLDRRCNRVSSGQSMLRDWDQVKPMIGRA
jgi:hypothetical protein